MSIENNIIDFEEILAICTGEKDSSITEYWFAWQTLVDSGKIKELSDDMKLEAVIYLNKGYLKWPH